MNRKELIQAIGASTKLAPKAVNTVINALMAHLQTELAKGEQAKLPGFGTFVKRPPAQEGKPARILFRPAASKEERQSKKARRSGGGGE
jgi:nucleoid DNA-binding protein